MSKTLITGATGFIGRALCNKLSKSGKSVRGAIRSSNSLSLGTNFENVSVGDISYQTNWNDALTGIDYVVHCAARAHIMNESKKNALEIYRSVNVDGTKRLAEQSVAAGVKKFIFLSSIKVNGENTYNKHDYSIFNNQKKFFFRHDDISNPSDSYSVSKYEAERVLWDISSKTGLKVIVLRLPLVYGNGAKGNLVRLSNLIKSNIPLPLSLVNNHRSMIGIDNLIDLIIKCIYKPDIFAKTFLVSDGEDLSTVDLIKHIALSMGRKVRFFPIPILLLRLIGFCFGKSNEINRLVGSLRIDNSYTKKTLNWTPPISVEEGIRRMVQGK